MANKKMVDATPRQILLYLPNLIGYTRILLSITSLTLMILSPTSFILSSVLYLSSFIGDLFDGMVARKYNQTSTFGGLMDMVTDRCSTTGLLCVLIREFADKSGFVLLFTLLIILDISSHWCQMYSTTSQQTHHKSAEGNVNRFFLVRLYYSSYPFFGYCCVGAEFTYMTIYILVRMRAEEMGGGLLEMIKVAGEWFLYLAIPACAVKQIVNMSQLCSSCYAVAEYDAKTKNKSK